MSLPLPKILQRLWKGWGIAQGLGLVLPDFAELESHRIIKLFAL